MVIVEKIWKLPKEVNQEPLIRGIQWPKEKKPNTHKKLKIKQHEHTTIQVMTPLALLLLQSVDKSWNRKGGQN